MKKVLLLLVIIGLISCEGPEGPMGPEGPQGKQGYGTNWYNTSFTINSNEWKVGGGKPGDLNTYFYVDKDISQLTKSVFDEGTIIGYIETEKGVKTGLPYVWHLGTVVNSEDYLWTKTYDFDFVEGGVRFYITYNNFDTGIKPTYNETFHIVLMW